MVAAQFRELIRRIRRRWQRAEPLQVDLPGDTGMKVLHVGNVAQNAYRNAKLLNAAGVASYVAHYDFFHFACCPEWDELSAGDYTLDDFGDPYYPNFLSVPEGESACPPWAAVGPQFLITAYFDLLSDNNPRAELARAALIYNRLKAARLKTTTPQAQLLDEAGFEDMMSGLHVSEPLMALLREVRVGDDMVGVLRDALREHTDAETAANFTPPLAADYADSLLANRPQDQKMFRDRREAGFNYAVGLEFDAAAYPAFDPPSGLNPDDAAVYAASVPWWHRLFTKFDAVILYGQTPLLGYLSQQPYIAYEHGSIRDLPHDQDNLVSRLLKLSYEAADRVLITNMDYICAEQRITLSDEQKVYTPHAFDERKAFAASALAPEFSPDRKTLFFAPARHSWIDTNESKCNDRVVHAVAQLVQEGVPDFTVRFINWGKDADATRALIQEKGVEAYFEWIAPVPPRTLWDHYLEANAVIDQFFFPAVGGISIETLSLGRRLITYTRPDVDTEYWGEPMPVLTASSVGDIVGRMREVLNDPLDTAGQGKKAQDFFLRKNSGAAIIQLVLGAIKSQQSAG